MRALTQPTDTLAAIRPPTRGVLRSNSHCMPPGIVGARIAAMVVQERHGNSGGPEMSVVRVEWSPYCEANRGYRRCLYALVHGPSGEVLYVGKAEARSVAERVGDKQDVIELLLERGVALDDLAYLVGVLRVAEGRRRTRPVLQDVEAFLIHRIKPIGNTMGVNGFSVRSALVNGGIEVHCIGAWPKGPCLY